ncbi:hypothetical protein [Flavitalea sp.]|nr:hypothetical protein [Flavitalea sp.]
MKKLLIPVLAVGVSVFSAFVTRPTTLWFSYTHFSSTDPAERLDRDNYDVTTPVCTPSQNMLCSIEAEADLDDKPIIPSSSDLHTALYNGGDTKPDFGSPLIKGKPY